MTHVLLGLLNRFEYVILVYFVFVNGWYLALMVSAMLEMRRHASLTSGQSRWKVLSSPLAPSISLIAPAFNEESTIVESLSALLTLQYPNLEVVVINDGSKDRTIDILREHFHLVPVHPIYQRRIVTQPVRSLYRSAVYPNLVVVDKENGRKADALNAGINVATGSLVCAIDVDTIIEPDALQRMVRPFLESDDVFAVGGTIRVANSCVIRGGRVVDARVPTHPLAGIQVVEYLRAFLFGRLGWNRLGGNLIISGAFGLFRRDDVLAVGGYAHDSIGEDFELILRMRRRTYENGRRQRVAFVPDPVAWTEVPETIKNLGSQRDRWHRGLADTLWRHRQVFMNPRYGAMGMAVFPHFVIVELLAPVVELLGLCGLALGLALGAFDKVFALMFFLFAYGLGALLTMISLALDELGVRRYTRMRDRALLIFWTLVENFGYRQLTVYWRLKGLENYFRKQTAWGDMTRKGFGPMPTSSTPGGSRPPSGRAASIALLVGMLGVSAQAAKAQSAADSAWLRGDRASAQLLYARQLAADSTDAVALYRSAMMLAWDRHWDESLAMYDRLIALHPQNLEIRTARARVLAWKGKLHDALRETSAILHIEPRLGSAWRAHARFLAWIGDLRGAERAWEAALHVYAHDAEALAGLAQTLRWQGREPAAHAAAYMAIRLDPNDETAQSEFRILQSARAPRLTPRLIYETDSDGNAIRTLLMGGMYHPLNTLALHGEAYVRSAIFDGGAFERRATPRGASLTADVLLEPGWLVSAQLGASDPDADSLGLAPTLGFAVTSPRRELVQATIALRHAGFDATSLVAARGVVVSEASLALNTGLENLVRVSGEATIASYHGRISDESNTRTGGRLEVTGMVNREIAIGGAMRAFAFTRDLSDGYFDPKSYLLGEILSRWERELSNWQLTGDAAVGLQRIGSGAATGAFRVGGSTTWRVAEGRAITLSLIHANARTSALSAETPSGYRYTSISLAARWHP
jgi:cellulose synthase/poly-beta-1,6-N-acetylglucosamine synthase-like glycosyltransferase